jgi:hypothetical protein
VELIHIYTDHYSTLPLILISYNRYWLPSIPPNSKNTFAYICIHSNVSTTIKMQYQSQLLALLPFLVELTSAHPVTAVSLSLSPEDILLDIGDVADEKGQYQALKARQAVRPVTCSYMMLIQRPESMLDPVVCPSSHFHHLGIEADG